MKILLAILILFSLFGLVFLLLWVLKPNLTILTKLNLTPATISTLFNLIIISIMVITLIVTINYATQQINESNRSTEKQINKMQEQIDTFKKETENLIRSAEKQRKMEFISRMETLLTELKVNLLICDKEIIGSYEKNKGERALPVPESRFNYSMLNNILSTGEVIDEKTRIALWDTFRRMQIINSLLSQALEIRHTEHIADPKDQMLISGRRGKVNGLVKDSASFALELKKMLEKSISLINDLKNT